MANDIEKLMRHIVDRVLARQDVIRVDLDADATDGGVELARNKQRALRDEEVRLARMTGPFHKGLQRAYAAMRAGGDSISLDDRNEDENRQADALVNFLVRTKLASSTTRETDKQHYIYTISVDWQALEHVATEANVDLGNVLDGGD
jgi:hypothetical protein